jgi:hypothetical protein
MKISSLLAVFVTWLVLLGLASGCVSVPPSIEMTNALPYDSIVVQNHTDYPLTTGKAWIVPGKELALSNCVPDARGNLSINVVAKKRVMLGDILVWQSVGECKKTVEIERGGPGHIITINDRDF